MAAPDSDWLGAALVFLTAAVVAVPLAKRLGLGAILGYLVAGVAIGPGALALVADPQSVLHVAEFGVVLMLFLVGLELEPQRLWAMRRPIFGTGGLQVLASTGLLMGVGVAAGLDWRLALVGGLALSMSSTAIGLGVMAERNLMPTPGGQQVLAVMLLQDIAAIPILALVPLLAVSPTGGSDVHWAWQVGKAAAMVAALVLGGRWLLTPALRWIARTGSSEMFTAAALLLVVASAFLMRAAGLSMALGAFLAGVLLAGSEYRRELETDLEPFKGLLLGLFFIAVGMSIDLATVAAMPGLVAALVLGFVALKAAVLWPLARAQKLPLGDRPFFVLLLAQGGEFGFVVAQTGLGAGVLSAQANSVLLAAIALSMLLTPLLLLVVDRWWLPRLSGCAPAKAHDAPELNEPHHAPVVIAGFGRYGQIVGRMLSAQGLKATVLDHDPEQVESVRKFGWEAYFGDATRLDLLRNAGAETARVLVIALDDVAQSEALARLAREHFPRLTVVARARNVTHYAALKRAGVQHVERETFESALVSARTVLEQMGLTPHRAWQQAQAFRVHNVEQLEAMVPHMGDEQKLIALSKQGRQQLETLWAEQRLAEAQRSAGKGWMDKAND